jgi:anthranilate synthase/aminodeoxychorismate synthase-like glutamine amidotransferase
MDVLLIDNYDSFTYNIYQYMQELGAAVAVHRNDAITLEDIDEMAPRRIVVSPGPGRPEDAGISVDTIRRFCGRIPILGVCLGHQAIGYAFGGRIIRSKRIMHGKTSEVSHDGAGLFAGVSDPFTATRYHSLVIDPQAVPEDLAVTATSDDGEVMGVRVKGAPCYGIQFHPESILTLEGKKILDNFLRML